MAFDIADWDIAASDDTGYISYDPTDGRVVGKSDGSTLGANVQLTVSSEAATVNLRNGTDILAYFKPSEIGIGKWSESTKSGDSAEISFYGGSGKLGLEVGETRDSMTFYAPGEARIHGHNVYIESGAYGDTLTMGWGELRFNSGNVYGAHVLYSNASGSSSTITLSDAVENYKWLDVTCYKPNKVEEKRWTQRIDATAFSNSTGTDFMWSGLAISGTHQIVARGGYAAGKYIYMGGQYYYNTGGTSGEDSSDLMTITKVVGWK